LAADHDRSFMRTGVVKVVSNRFLQLQRPLRFAACNHKHVTLLGAFISNTASAAFFLPVLLA
jgi:di/tricarboxylate transporter